MLRVNYRFIIVGGSYVASERCTLFRYGLIERNREWAWEKENTEINKTGIFFLNYITYKRISYIVRKPHINGYGMNVIFRCGTLKRSVFLCGLYLITGSYSGI